MANLEKIQRLFKKRFLVIWTVLSLVSMVMLSIFLSSFIAVSGGLFPLDIRLSYTFDEVLQLFAVLGPEGRSTYTLIQAADTLFPIAYSMLFFTLIGMTLPKAVDEDSWMNYTVFIPLLGGLFDYIENISVATQIASYPTLSQTVVLIASTATVFKWIFNAMAIIILLVLIVNSRMSKEE